MEGFQADDDLGQHLGGLLEGEDAVGQLGLVVDEVAAVAVLQHEVDAGLVLEDVVQLDDVGRVHRLHALDLPVQVLPQVRLVLDHPHRDQLQGQLLPLLVLHQVHVPVRPLPQAPLVLVLIQEHKILCTA